MRHIPVKNEKKGIALNTKKAVPCYIRKFIRSCVTISDVLKKELLISHNVWNMTNRYVGPNNITLDSTIK